MGELRERFDWVICDSPAGIERGATLAMRHADVAVVVTNPEVSSVRDSDRIIGLLDSKTLKAEKGERIDKHLLLTRYDPARAERGEMLKTEDVLEILSIPLLGIIPESEEVLRASNVGSPVTIANPLERAGARLCRRGAAALGRDRRADRSRPTSGACSASCSRGGPHEPVQLLPEGRIGAGRARPAADPARARAHHRRRLGPGRDPARGDPRGDQEARAGRSRQGAGEDGPRRVGLDARSRHRDPDADQGDGEALLRAGSRRREVGGRRGQRSRKPLAGEDCAGRGIKFPSLTPAGPGWPLRRHVLREGVLEIRMPARQRGPVLDDVVHRPAHALLVHGARHVVVRAEDVEVARRHLRQHEVDDLLRPSRRRPASPRSGRTR